MVTFSGLYKKLMIAVLFFVLLSVIWLGPHWLSWHEYHPFENIVMQLLLTLMMVLGASFMFFISYFQLYKVNAASVEKNVKSDKNQLAAEEYHRQVKQFFSDMYGVFKSFGWQKEYFLKKSPWYLLVGKQGSGKTNLLLQANLTLIPADPLLKRGAEINFPHTWYFTKESVFLELPLGREKADSLPNHGMAPSQFNSPFWTALLKFIKKYRPKSRLNGVIIALDLPDSMSCLDGYESACQAELKAALYQIHQVLKIQLPVYLVLTKCDLIAGFQEFFADLDKEGHEQPWGIAFPRVACSDRQQAANYFDKEFAALINKLNERLLLRLEMERHADNRTLISYFPQQMQLCKQLLTGFILQDEAACLRGIYFSSSLQEGVPVDRLMSMLSSRFELEEVIPFGLSAQRKPFFLQRLFSDVVLPEISWTLQSSYWQRRHQASYQASWLVAGLIVLISIGGFWYSYMLNKDYLWEVAEYLPGYQQAVNAYRATDKELLGVLPILNSLKNIQSVYADRPFSLAWFEFYQPLRIRSKIDAVWQKVLSAVLMPKVALRIESLLQRPQLEAEILYQALKAYLVFSPHVKGDPQWLKPPMAYDLAHTLQGYPDEQAQLTNYLSEGIRYPIENKPLNEAVIARARERLRRILPVQFAYYEIKQEADRSQNQFSLDDRVGPLFSSTFMYADARLASLSTLYTRAGYMGLQGKRSAALIRRTAKIYQLLGLGPAINPDALSAQMTSAFWALYGTDYAQRWQRFLANIHVAPFTSLSQGRQIVDGLAGVNTPLLKLLYFLKDNTAPVHGNSIQVAQRFASINGVTQASKFVTQYGRSIKILGALRDYLTALDNSPNTAQLEFQDASAIMQNKLPTNPIVLLRTQAKQLPAPLSVWLTEVADNSMGLLLSGAHQVASTAWQSHILPYYQANIAGRFPFAASSASFVNMANFGDFFGDGGIFSRYYLTYLAPFIDTRHGEWRPYTFGSHSIGLSGRALQQLRGAWLIRSLYFQNGNNPALQFSLQPKYLDPQASSINVQLANGSISYRHGPLQSTEWRWPFVGDTQQVSVSFSDFQGHNDSYSFDGPWAWFELLSASHLTPTGRPGQYVWMVSRGKHKAIFELSAPNNLPMFDLNALKSWSLPSSI